MEHYVYVRQYHAAMLWAKKIKFMLWVVGMPNLSEINPVYSYSYLLKYPQTNVKYN